MTYARGGRSQGVSAGAGRGGIAQCNPRAVVPAPARRDGAVYDGFVGNPVADRSPFEQLEVPTLIISASGDTLAPYAFATRAARRIPNATLVTIERGGHLFLGNDDKVREEIRAFITSALHVDTNGREAGARPARGNR